jgi:hypothetical protein
MVERKGVLVTLGVCCALLLGYRSIDVILGRKCRQITIA